MSHPDSAAFSVKVRRISQEPVKYVLSMSPGAGMGLVQQCCDEGHADIDAAALHGSMVLYRLLAPPR